MTRKKLIAIVPPLGVAMIMLSMPVLSDPSEAKKSSTKSDSTLALKIGGPLLVSFSNDGVLMVRKDDQGGAQFVYETKRLVLSYADNDGRLSVDIINEDGTRVKLLDLDGDMIPDVRRTLDKDFNQISVERLRFEREKKK